MKYTGKSVKARKSKLRLKRQFVPVLYFGIIFSCVLMGSILLKSAPTLSKSNISINLIGSDNIVLNLNEEYYDEGITLFDNENVVSSKDIDLKVESNIDTNAIGTYEVNYEIKYKDNEYSLKREVTVKDDISPVITTSSDFITVNKCNGKLSDSLDYYAFDNYDGNITDKVVVEKYDDKYVLRVMDSSLNETVKELTIIDEKNYTIQLNGHKNVYVELNGEYEEEGATLLNECGKKVSGDIEIISDIDLSVPGKYTVEYRYSYDDKQVSNYRYVNVYQKYESDIITSDEEKVVYLTFDDGPGQYTEELLNILDKYNVKATFFVTNQFKKYVPLIEEESKRGHKVAVHSLTHNWNIYDSLEDYMYDFNQMNDIIYNYTGKRSNIFRFPGGGSNTVSRGHSTKVVSAIVSNMNKLGYYYYDWNVDSEDAAGASSEKIKNNVIKGISNRNYSVVLMHDIKRNTIDVIEDIIIYGKENGYTFKVIDEDTPTVHHHVNN